jgi:hypothetical protein
MDTDRKATAENRFHLSFVIRHSPFVALVILLAGCSSWDLKSKLPWASSEEKLKQEKFQRPVRMVAIWSPTTISAPGKGVTRGLGGRLYFYNDEGEAIPVEGQLIVYAYDDSNRKQNVSHVNTTGGVDEPDRKFAFTSEQFSGHFSPTDLGASYSVWIPWGPLDGPPAKVSVVPVFTSSGGNVVMAQASRNLLKGTTPLTLADNGQEMLPAEQAVARASYPPKATELRTTTIPVPDTTAERIKRAGEMPYPQPPTNGQSMPAAAYPLPAATNMTPGTAPSMLPTATGIPPNQNRTANAGVGEVPGPWWPPQRPPARFAQPRFPVPEGPAPQPAFDHAPLQQNPTESPYGQPSPREWNSPSPNQGAFSAASQTAGPGW